MAIQFDANQPKLPVAPHDPLKQARTARIEAKTEDALLSPHARLSPTQIQNYKTFAHDILGKIGELKDGQLPSLGKLDPHRWESFFGRTPEQQRVHDATAPRKGDGAAAAEVRGRYREAHSQAMRERTAASRQAELLGDGVHKQADGSVVTVRSDAKSGKRTVETRNGDNSKSVTFDPAHPDSVSVETHRGGETNRLELDGTSLRKTSQGRAPLVDLTIQERFTLDSEGNPNHQLAVGQGQGAATVFNATALPDGSCDWHSGNSPRWRFPGQDRVVDPGFDPNHGMPDLPDPLGGRPPVDAGFDANHGRPQLPPPIFPTFDPKNPNAFATIIDKGYDPNHGRPPVEPPLGDGEPIDKGYDPNHGRPALEPPFGHSEPIDKGYDPNHGRPRLDDTLPDWLLDYNYGRRSFSDSLPWWRAPRVGGDE